MSKQEINKVIVVGAGTMGSGIAQVAADGGCTVVLTDINETFVSNGLANIERNLKRAVEKGKMTADRMSEILSAVHGTASKDDVAREASSTDLVIEAIVEDTAIKKALFLEMDQVCSPDTVFASNTSALSVTELATSTGRPDRFIGLHFFNPVPVMQLVEVVGGAATSSEVIELCTRFVEKIGKTSVRVNEAPGFLVNRMLIPMVNEAIFILMEGVAAAEDIDASMRLGANHPIGPLALADLVGLDVCLAIMTTLYREFGDTKYRPCPLLQKMVRAGYLGRKTGKGFYEYAGRG
jgi:3-hydroxybutyryl-CoA dehydrogenase